MLGPHRDGKEWLFRELKRTQHKLQLDSGPIMFRPLQGHWRSNPSVLQIWRCTFFPGTFVQSSLFASITFRPCGNHASYHLLNIITCPSKLGRPIPQIWCRQGWVAGRTIVFGREEQVVNPLIKKLLGCMRTISHYDLTLFPFSLSYSFLHETFAWNIELELK